ncbi:MAG: shikimate kinase [Flavobacteriaceae bacterium]|nr:shikimate kinase [Flavobacteriaceae bacterium]
MIITLLGYMGSGKSTIGVDLATILEYEFIDLDNFIEEKENLSVKDIFKAKGEIYFRRLENTCLKEIYTLQNNVVLSLGGGTPCFYGNMELINSENSKSIYLKLLPKSLSDRLFKEKENRPLINHLKTEDDLIEFIAIHLFERQSFYNQASSIISTDNLTIKETVEKIVKVLY